MIRDHQLRAENSFKSFPISQQIPAILHARLVAMVRDQFKLYKVAVHRHGS